ncbi:hypothetical protein BGP_2608 [Beggiatoa sp. PS]|nr:hypothetical protein BGP_2608 [Beggiatoa sp. PS]
MSIREDSYIVVLTYDLHQADNKIYSQIKKQLKEQNFKADTRLPNNVFISSFPIKGNEASKLKDELSSKIKEIFTQQKVDAKYLLIVGKDWDGSLDKIP